MDSDFDTSDDDPGDAVDILHVDQEQNGSSTTQNTCNKQTSSDEGDSDDQRLSAPHWSGAGQGSSDVAAGQGHHLCEQPAPSTSNPVRPVGGSVSTNTAHASKRTAGGQVSELLDALVPESGETSYSTTVETRGDPQSDVKEVHVHLTQTNIHNPAAIALGGPVVVKSPKKKKSDTTRPQTEIQKLRSETERKFEKWTEGMVKTQATQTVQDKISQGKTWITITGSPGEGKTTAGYLVLKYLHSMGRNVYDIQTPEEYFKIKGTKEPVVMLNDILGFSEFDSGEMKRWQSVLFDILSVNEHRGEEMKERKDKPRLTVILISRSSVLNAASRHLGRFKDLVLNKESVIDFTHGQDIAVEERMKIWTYHSEKYNIRISEKIAREICEMSLPHGFPHCCRLFADMYSKNKKLNMKLFFSKPVEFLNQTMESLMMDAVTGPLLREMLKNDGSLQLNSITDYEKRFQYTSVIDTLSGTYLRQDGFTVTFHHPSVYDSAAFVVCTKDPMFVLEHCTLSFLNERVQFSGLCSGMDTEIQHKVTIDDEYLCDFLDRLKTEFESDNILPTLSHQSFHDEGFVSNFMQCILSSSEVQPLSDSIQNLIHTMDRESKESFLFLMTKSRSDKILKYVCHFVELSHEEQMETLFGICEHSSVPSMEYFLCKFRNFNLNVKNSNLQTPLLQASTKSSESILTLLLERDVDINAVDKESYSVLDNICKHGVDGDGGVVKMLVKKGVDVNIKSSHYPYFPLHIACYEGHSNVVLALLEYGADIDQKDRFDKSALTYACSMNHKDVVTVLLDRGADNNKTDSDGYTLLYRACYRGHVNVVTLLLDRGADINKTNSGGNTPLNAACLSEDVNVVTLLLDRGADINKTGSGGNTPLYAACLSEDVNVVTLLLDRGADINKTNSGGNTPLHKACYRGHVNVVTLLLDRGADINKTNSGGNTPLYAACLSEDVNVVTLLLDRGADINKTGSGGNTPLYAARLSEDVNVVTLLLDRGADINKTNSGGNTPLHKACYRGHVNVVTLLLDRGADINKTNSGGNTPLHKACYRGHVNVVTLLLDRGADINKTGSGGNTPLYAACLSEDVNVVTLLLDRGADINKTDSGGNTPLNAAGFSEDVNVVTLLLDRGADINKTNSGGYTPLHKACYSGNVNVVTLLLDRGADINKTNSDGDTPLNAACLSEDVNVMTLLLDRGADINKTNSGGNTPLHRACYSGNVNVVTLLLDRGADINKTNSDGDTPLHTARYWGYVNVVTVLSDSGTDNITNLGPVS